VSGIPLIHCPVCAVELAGPIDICTTCQTPHHADCARFVGRCALAGCGAYEFMSIDPVEAGFPAAPAAAAGAPAAPEDPPPRVAAVAGGAARPVSAAVPAVVSGAVPAPLPVAPATAIARRISASIGLLTRNPGIAVPVGILMLIGSVIPLAALKMLGAKAWILTQVALMFGWLIGQAMTVIMLAARAQGKDHSARHALALAAQRGPRVIGTALASGVISILPLSAGIVIALSGLVGLNPLMVVAGAGLTLFGFKRFVGYSLVPIVAAMGTEDEPKDALVRSTELVATARTQAALSVVGVMFTSLVIVPMLPLFLGLLFNEALALITTAYWTLYYLEARRERRD
jgi:hypothetical protein